MNAFGLIATLAQVLSWIIVARLILDMLLRAGYFTDNRVVEKIRWFLNGISEPILSPIRRLVHRGSSPVIFDFSPMVAILLLWLVSWIFGTAA